MGDHRDRHGDGDVLYGPSTTVTDGLDNGLQDRKICHPVHYIFISFDVPPIP